MSLRELNYRHLWHPYTDMAAFPSKPYLCIERAAGSYLHTIDGRRLIDGIASWWCVNLGHSQPSIVTAIQEQAEKLQHSMLGGMSHPLAVILAARLAERAPGDLNRVYFAADGSSVIEAAVKLAVQYWQSQGLPQKSRFLTLSGAYHGDTIGAMAVSATDWFTENYRPLLRPALTAPSPHARSSDPARIEAAAAGALEKAGSILERHGQELAAVLIEPLVQGAAGVRIYPESYLQGIAHLCQTHGVLLIADEIATGFGRTGTWFACKQAGITPDILCLGKGLTGGYLPLSAMIATERVYAPFSEQASTPRIFYDGHTFCGNPITCVAAVAALDLYDEILESDVTKDNERQITTIFQGLAQHPDVEYARSLGMVGMMSLRKDAGEAERASRICAMCIERGLFVRPLGEVVYLWPPLTISPDELEEAGRVLQHALTG